jgi:hypothetical protein
MWAAASGPVFRWGVAAMNYLYTKPVFDALAFLQGDAAPPASGELAEQRAAADLTLDAALRNVPLPDGLMTRLGKLAHSMPDENADQVDWLGC